MNLIRDYHEENDGRAAYRLIEETYRKFNLGFAAPADQGKLLAPFCQGGCAELIRQAAIARMLRCKLIDGFMVGEEA